jgi:hypothetical protein
MANEPSSLTPADLAAARNTAEQFILAVQRGDEPAARSMLILVEGEKMDFKSMHESMTAYELGQPKADGEVAVVDAKITATTPGEGTPAQGEAAPEVKELPLVLRRVDGAWKIDMGASITRLMGGIDLGQMMEQMAKGLGDVMAKGMEAVGEAFSALSAPEGQAKPADTERPEDKKKAKCKKKNAKY